MMALIAKRWVYSRCKDGMHLALHYSAHIKTNLLRSRLLAVILVGSVVQGVSTAPRSLHRWLPQCFSPPTYNRDDDSRHDNDKGYTDGNHGGSGDDRLEDDDDDDHSDHRDDSHNRDKCHSRENRDTRNYSDGRSMTMARTASREEGITARFVKIQTRTGPQTMAKVVEKRCMKHPEYET